MSLLTNVLILTMCANIYLAAAYHQKFYANRKPKPPKNDTTGGEPEKDEESQKTLEKAIIHFACGCSGILISPSYVITAQHCLWVYPDPSYVSLTMLIEDEAKTKQWYTIRDWNMPAQTDDIFGKLDVAVLRLTDPILEAIPIRLCSQPLKGGIKAQVVGWLKKAKGSKSDKVTTVSVPLRTRDECSEKINGQGPLGYTMICTGGSSKDSLCNIDIGAALLYHDELCGILSFGTDCKNKKLPDVFADVYFGLPFIYKAMRAWDMDDLNIKRKIYL